ncbi:MAG: alpha-2-macroglobulin family protein [Deltaproteobacteria bacterium]|nr:alpha-2-macroglobulin family protein [Deltaproteobacteria bacterium]
MKTRLRARPGASWSLVTLVALVGASVSPEADAQRRRPTPTPDNSDDDAEAPEGADGVPTRAPVGGVNRRTGLELELHGLLQTVRGRPLMLRGAVFEVRGLATLRALPGARLTVYELDEHSVRQAQPLGEGRAEASGRFSLAVTPRVRRIEIVAQEGRTERSWTYNVRLLDATRRDLLTDRQLYEPGETIHGWLRVLDAMSGAPLAGQSVEWSVGGERGTARLGQSRVVTSDGGVSHTTVTIPTSAPHGQVPIVAVVQGERVETTVQIGRRTVERVFANLVLSERVVNPGARVTGRASITTPSGTPVSHAQVEISINNRSLGSYVTDRDGVAEIAFNAPEYLTQPVSSVVIVLRAVHPAHGTINARTTLTIARVPFEVDAEIANGALVPEVPQSIFLSIRDPRGVAAPASTTVTVEGPAIAGGRFRGTVDRHGILAVPARLPRNSAAMHTEGPCEGHVATSFDITVESAIPLAARLCVRAHTKALVVPRVLTPAVQMGARLEVAIERSPTARTRSVAVELLSGSTRSNRTVLLSTIASPSENRVSFTLPSGYMGPLMVRARPVGGEGVSEETGAMDAVLVRPASSFNLSLALDRPVYHVRDPGHLTVTTPAGVQGGFVAVVARDLTMHAGEQPWHLRWLGGAIEEAVADPSTPDADRLIRSAMAALVNVDEEPQRAAPLVAPDQAQDDTGSENSEREGDLRDPFVGRDELIRRGIGETMTQIEQAVEQATGDREQRGVIAANGRDFDPAVIHHLLARETLSEENTRTLGGGEMTVAMLSASDRSFVFHNVARRVARRKLVQLLGSLAQFAESSRSARTEPVDRWMSRIAGENPGMLRDPWGGTFTLRRVQPGSETLAIHSRLSGWELVSPGPDRAVGTADDVKNPFERVVPQGTPYAIASGEDSLLASLAVLDPGLSVLSRIVAAYGRLAEAASEEQVGDVTSASSSESVVAARMAAPEMADSMGVSGYGMGGGGRGEGTIGLGRFGTIGHGSGTGSGQGYGSGSGRMGRSYNSRGPMVSGAVLRRNGMLAELVRERFPATLFVMAERPISPTGTTVLDFTLADALTTYRIEAIAWTRDGWTASAQVEARVDQDIIIDAPVPPFAVVNDEIRLPIRVQNRSAQAMRLRAVIGAEGGLQLRGGQGAEIEIPGGESREIITDVVPSAPGRGNVLVSVVDARTGAALDSITRVMDVLAPARPVRTAVENLADGRVSLTLNVPADASFRDLGVLRVARAESLFGDPVGWVASEPSWAAWLLAMLNRSPTTAELRDNREMLALAQSMRRRSGDPGDIARRISALWSNTDITDRSLRGWFEQLTTRQEAIARAARTRRSRDMNTSNAFNGTEPSIQTLVGLAGAFSDTSRRTALRPMLQACIDSARLIVENETASESEPAIYARAAAALALTGPAHNARVAEFLRRAQRGEEDGFGAGAELLYAHEASSSLFVTEPISNGRALEALASLGVAWLAEGDRPKAFRVFSALARRTSTLSGWPASARALAMLLAHKITQLPPDNAAPQSVHVLVDGQPFDLPLVQGVAVLMARQLSMPGRHQIVVEVPEHTVLVAQAEARYGRPWSVQPMPRGTLAVSIDGEVGARDASSAFVIRTQNRSPRVLSSALLEVDIPAGAELDQTARDELTRRLAAPPVLTGRTLALRLRPLPPGGFVRLPLSLRWSVSGTLMGLGLGAYGGPELDAPVLVVAPRSIVIPDDGPQPSRPDARSPSERNAGPEENPAPTVDPEEVE